MSIKVRALVVPAKGDPRVVEGNSYDVIKNGIGGGTFTRIQMGLGDMWCDDEFLLVRPSPPVNWMATALTWQAHQGHYLEGTFILGDVVFTGKADVEGNTTSIDADFIAMCAEAFAVELP